MKNMILKEAPNHVGVYWPKNLDLLKPVSFQMDSRPNPGLALLPLHALSGCWSLSQSSRQFMAGQHRDE